MILLGSVGSFVRLYFHIILCYVILNLFCFNLFFLMLDKVATLFSSVFILFIFSSFHMYTCISFYFIM